MKKLICLLLAGIPAAAAPHWIVATTSHFEMYTPAKEYEAAQSLQTYEQVYYFFSQILGKPIQLDQRVRIVAFNGEKEFKLYRPNEGTFAFYQQAPIGDYIAEQDIQPEHSEMALHEFTHLVVAHLGLQLPVWLNEGMADLFSTLEPYKKDMARVGRPLTSRANLANERWMDWNTLLNADHNSSYYNERNKMSVFYAQSWVLTHMLWLSPEYAPKFNVFVAAVASGMSSQDAFQRVYGKSVADIDRDVHQHVNAKVTVRVFPVQLPKSDTDPDVQPLDDFRHDLVLAELKAFVPRTAPQGRDALKQLEAQRGDVAEVHEALGFAEWQTKDPQGAKAEFALASKAGSHNERMYYYLAALQTELHDPQQDALESLRKALDLNEQDGEARLMLGQLYASAKLYGAAVSTLLPLHDVKPEQAFPLTSTLAFCYMQLKSYDVASAFAKRAAQFATNDAERSHIEQLQSYIESVSSQAK